MPLNIKTHKFKIVSGLGWGHMSFHNRNNALAESICYKAKEMGKDCLALLMELANNNIPFKITKRIWTGDYEGEIFRNRVVKIDVGTEGTELWVFCA